MTVEKKDYCIEQLLLEVDILPPKQRDFVKYCLDSITVFIGSPSEIDKIKNDIYTVLLEHGESDNIIKKRHLATNGFLVRKPVDTLGKLGFNLPLLALDEMFMLKTYVNKGIVYGSSIFIAEPQGLL